MRDGLFENRGFGSFEETVVVRAAKADGDAAVRIGAVRGTVVVGSGDSSGAGSPTYAETADRVSVVIRRKEWLSAFAFAPRFGMKFDIASMGEVTVKRVQEAEHDFVCRCSRNMRAKEK